VRNSPIIHISLLLVILFSGTVWQSAIVFDFLINQEDIVLEKCINKENPDKHCHGTCYLNKQLTVVEEVSIPIELQSSTVSFDFWLLSYLDKYNVHLINHSGISIQIQSNPNIDLNRGQLSDVFHPPRVI